MSQSYSQKPKTSEVDIVFEILQTQGRPQHYYQLVEEVLNRLGLPQEPQRIAAVLTQINLDSRFAYVGQGEWGLKAWVPQRGSRRLPSLTVSHKVDDDHDDDMDKRLALDEKELKLADPSIDEELDDMELNLDDDELLDLDEEFDEEFDEEGPEDAEETREDNWE
ncbi:DNA-directed RNA polymerase subunit delta [Paradesulfitobacterium ferrireducens]|uniref:DNA-directed RNA polymerase subunit delta n=1 Tax=Paradesulfitobacterium ferrireducens TaxID=2816476 RepID=UPI001A8CDE62|nr:DNA-directed RNA polymerase subunit delta [Paradesulfitobacterium ferrireducens]